MARNLFLELCRWVSFISQIQGTCLSYMQTGKVDPTLGFTNGNSEDTDF